MRSHRRDSNDAYWKGDDRSGQKGSPLVNAAAPSKLERPMRRLEHALVDGIDERIMPLDGRVGNRRDVTSVAKR